MEERRQQLAEDLEDSFRGQLRTDDATAAIYSSDASLYEITPLAVAFPVDTADVQTLAAYCSHHQIPLIARGAGTGLAGGCLGEGVVVDFSHLMNQVIEIRDDSVRVQPGITRSALNAALRPHGRYFAPDPSGGSVTTIGGMIGVDAAGSRAFRVGSTRSHLKSLECVVAGGQCLELGKENVNSQAADESGITFVSDQASDSEALTNGDAQAVTNLSPATRKRELVSRVSRILEQSAALIDDYQPAMLRNSCGYMLRGVLNDGCVDFPRLLAGSEGTLGLVTEATLYTLPLSTARGLVTIMFGSMQAALQAMQLLLILDPSACDLLDRRLLSLGRDSDVRFVETVRPDAEAGLFLEFTSHSEADVRQRIQNAMTLLESTEHAYVVTNTTFNESEINHLWRLPASVVPLLAGLKGNSRPLPFVEDIAVPREEISGFLTLAQRTFQKYEVTATLYAHAASGQLHLRPMLPNPTRDNPGQLEAIARDLYQHVKKVRGTISGEHGDGLSRTAFIRTQYGPLYRTFQQIKSAFDPDQILNPHKIISNDGQLTIRHLRRLTTAEPSNDGDESTSLLPILQLDWPPSETMETAARCNGCGSCRSVEDELRMCPFYRLEPSEKHSPRSKANLLRRMLSTLSPTDIATSPAAREISESCFNCKQCELECPSHVQIPQLVLEARAQYVAAHGLSKTDWLLSRFHTYANLASRFTFMTNRLLRHGVFRRVLRRTIGIAENRRLPLFHGQPFLRSARVRSEHNVRDPNVATDSVVYFVDYFANNHDPDLAQAFLRILDHNRIRSFVPPDQTVSGMAMLAVGDVNAAREMAEANIASLAEAARDGSAIVCTEPSAALCLKTEYPRLIRNADTETIAKQTLDAGEFLWQRHLSGKLRTDFEPLQLEVVYHTPCHVKALSENTGLCNLLELIPGVTVHRIEKGCSGMAGTFGLAAENFDQSMAMGQDLIDTMKTTTVNAGVTDCSSCRMQMEQAASIPTVHPLKILALAYGVMPQLNTALRRRPNGRVLS